MGTYAWVAITSPRSAHTPRIELPEFYQQAPFPTYPEYRFDPCSRRPPPLPLSTAWKGELKWHLVQRCYQEYQEALKRYSPSPICLQTPADFAYRRGLKLEWERRTLILPEELLTPEQIHLLLPFLAHHLAWFNSDDDELQSTRSSQPSRTHWLLTITGNFLWLPVVCKHQYAWEAWLIARIHDADTFAHLLGQGERLEHQLRRQQAALEQAHEADPNTPTLVSRIGHLEVLRKEEHAQMRQLGLTPKEPPLVQEAPPPQLKRGTRRHLP